MSHLIGVIIVKFGHGTGCYSPKKQYNDKVKRHAARYPVKLRQEHKMSRVPLKFGGARGYGQTKIDQRMIGPPVK
jgi:hypothetical protein